MQRAFSYVVILLGIWQFFSLEYRRWGKWILQGRSSAGSCAEAAADASTQDGRHQIPYRDRAGHAQQDLTFPSQLPEGGEPLVVEN